MISMIELEMCVWRDEHEVKVEGWVRWKTQYGGVEVEDRGWGKKTQVFTHCLHSHVVSLTCLFIMANTLKTTEWRTECPV